MSSKLSKRATNWSRFSNKVIDHIENYTVPQYGDEGEDPMTNYTVEELLKQAEKYIKRHGRNAREGQDGLDKVKAVHCIQMAFDLIEELP